QTVSEDRLDLSRGRPVQKSNPVTLPRRLLRFRSERRGERCGQRGQQEPAAVHHFCHSSMSRRAITILLALPLPPAAEGRPPLPRAGLLPRAEGLAASWA